MVAVCAVYNGESDPLQDLGLVRPVHHPPASHHCGHVVVVLAGLWQADGLDDCGEHRERTVRNIWDNLPSVNISGLHSLITAISLSNLISLT